ncbi:SDR family oxidoreductase [Lysobacter sp. MMG2]|uniref:SDR family oxidoreductase n=1 Tax=Lysobacter sp. MMG2 TaxID=2801338 RepID=UPI001C226948|nr:SDR family oxidoreductase [Lysobacter sp. MMG2]MBU8977986.1 SDR family oxidoreductase [Lysobacter sp. MMG2]
MQEKRLRVLVTGATGLVGAAVVEALLRRGHDVLPATRDTAHALRRWPGRRAIAADFTFDVEPAAWLPRLVGVDAVVNAVGIFREHGGETFRSMHETAPKALFEACAMARVRRVVQISALGADLRAETGFHRSKRVADQALLALPLEGCVVRPSVVFAPDGASTQLFLGWASLPWLPLPDEGEQRIQPLHLDDLAEAVAALVEGDTVPHVLDAVGPAALSLRAYLGALRAQLGLPVTRTVQVPGHWLNSGARLLQRGARHGFATDTLRMLARWNAGDAEAITALLGRPPRDVTHFIAPEHARTLLTFARLHWLLPMLRLSIAIVWLGAGLVTLGPYPIADSLALLPREGLPSVLARGALHTVAAVDILLGLSMLWPPPRWLLKLQAAVIVAYTVVLGIAVPALWLHPLAPLLKNLPILAGLALLHELHDRDLRATR